MWSKLGFMPFKLLLNKEIMNYTEAQVDIDAQFLRRRANVAVKLIVGKNVYYIRQNRLINKLFSRYVLKTSKGSCKQGVLDVLF